MEQLIKWDPLEIKSVTHVVNTYVLAVIEQSFEEQPALSDSCSYGIITCEY